MKKTMLLLSLISCSALPTLKVTVEELQQQANDLMKQYKENCKQSYDDKTLCYPKKTSKYALGDCHQTRTDLDTTVDKLALVIGMNTSESTSQEELEEYHGILKDIFDTNCGVTIHADIASKKHSGLSNETCKTVLGALRTVYALAR